MQTRNLRAVTIVDAGKGAALNYGQLFLCSFGTTSTAVETTGTPMDSSLRSE